MGGFFSGLAAGIGDHLHEQHLLNLQQQVEAKRNLLDNYNVLLKDPHMQDVHDQIAQVLLKAASTDPTKLHKQIGKQGGEFDPTQWQVLAQQRAAGRAPSPVNQGQNPTSIPAAPPGHEQAPGGQAQMAQPWNDTTGDGGMNVPPPPGQFSPGLPKPAQPGQPGQPFANPSPASPAGDGAGSQASTPPANPQLLTPPPGIEQSIGALPPPQGSPAPQSTSLPSPIQAAAVAPPPVEPDWASTHNALGGLTWQESQRRAHLDLTSTEGIKNKAELERQIQLQNAEGDRQIRVDQQKRKSQMQAAMEGAKQAGIQFDETNPQSFAQAMQSATPSQLRMAEFFAGQSPRITRDLISVSPGGGVFDPNTGKMTLNPQLPPALMDRQIAFETLGSQIGKTVDKLSAEEKQIAEFINNPKGSTGPDIARKFSEFIAENKRIPTPKERTQIEAAEEQRLKNITSPTQRITIQNQGAMNSAPASAIDLAAQNALQTGDIPKVNGRNAPYVLRVIERMGELAKAQGVPINQIALQGMATKARSASLKQLEVQSNQVEAFEKNTTKNLDLALEQSGKTDRTGSPLINRYLQAVQKNSYGDEDVRLLHNYVVTAANEYAKVMSGSNSGQTTDAARDQALGVLNEAMQKGEFRTAVIGMKKEMKNRIDTFNEEKSQVRGLMGAQGANAVSSPSTAAGSGLQPGWSVQIVK